MTGYRERMDLLVTAVQTVCVTADLVDLPDLLRELERVEVMAPLLEPTAYMRGGANNLRDQRIVLRAVARFLDDVAPVFT